MIDNFFIGFIVGFAFAGEIMWFYVKQKNGRNNNL